MADALKMHQFGSREVLEETLKHTVGGFVGLQLHEHPLRGTVRATSRWRLEIAS